MKKKYQKWLGLAAVFALLLSAALSLTSSAFYYSGYVNSFLGITGESIEVSGDTNYYPSAYGPLNAENADRLIADERDHNIRAMYEGTVLLRNENSALPLAAGERSVTVLAIQSTTPSINPMPETPALTLTGAANCIPPWRPPVSRSIPPCGTHMQTAASSAPRWRPGAVLLWAKRPPAFTPTR